MMSLLYYSQSFLSFLNKIFILLMYNNLIINTIIVNDSQLVFISQRHKVTKEFFL